MRDPYICTPVHIREALNGFVVTVEPDYRQHAFSEMPSTIGPSQLVPEPPPTEQTYVFVNMTDLILFLCQHYQYEPCGVAKEFMRDTHG